MATSNEAPVDPPSPLVQSAHPALAAAFVEALVSGARREASLAVQDAVERGFGIEELYLEVVQPALREVGRQWQVGDITVAQEHLATATAQMIMAQLYPKIFELPTGTRGTFVATCVAGNLHEVGARMLADVFTLHGWQAHLLGADVPTDDVVEMVVRMGADVVAISATMDDQLDAVAALIGAIRARSTVVILVGGVPFLDAPHLADEVGADGTALDARAAVQLAESLVPA